MSFDAGSLACKLEVMRLCLKVNSGILRFIICSLPR